MDSRLQQHVEKGREDGLYISCVASSANLWAVIMDAGTGFTSQVYEISPMFLHKVGITITCFQFGISYLLNHLLSQKFKLIENGEFHYLIIILTLSLNQ